jgi:hypothetical protein
MHLLTHTTPDQTTSFFNQRLTILPRSKGQDTGEGAANLHCGDFLKVRLASGGAHGQSV